MLIIGLVGFAAASAVGGAATSSRCWSSAAARRGVRRAAGPGRAVHADRHVRRPGRPPPGRSASTARSHGAVVALGVALVWQAAPLARNAIGISLEQAQAASFWRPAQRFFDPATHLDHRDPDYRVEVVATWGHWESYYLAGKAGIPIARGWHRQDDFPQNRVFYQPGGLTADTYRTWLSDLAVRYVLLPHDELDSSARAEARLLLSGQSGLRQVAEDSRWTIYEVPDPTPILTPPAGPTPCARRRPASTA